MFPVFSCCLSCSPSFLFIIHEAEINPSPIRDIHLNRGKDGRCDVITVGANSENAPIARQLSVDSSAFPGGFRTNIVRDAAGKARGLTVGSRRQSLSLVKLLADHGVCVTAKESSTKAVWVKQLNKNVERNLMFGLQH